MNLGNKEYAKFRINNNFQPINILDLVKSKNAKNLELFIKLSNLISMLKYIKINVQF